MKIKKLTPLEKSKLRDKIAIHAYFSNKSSSLMGAYRLADRMIEVRGAGQEEVEMDCGCGEPKDGRVIPTIPPVDRLTYTKSKQSAPSILLQLLLVCLLFAGVVYISTQVVEFIRWVF